MIGAVRAFLELLDGPPLPDARRLPTLAEALDRLALAYHEAPTGHPSDGGDLPEKRLRTYAEERAAASANFPNLGFYPSLLSVDLAARLPNANDIVMGDAIDDLADIAGDLREVLWRHENFGTENAAFHFRELYRIHWGRHHLRGLQLHIQGELFSAR